MVLITIRFTPCSPGKNTVVSTETQERKYTPWWGFALVVLAGLAAIGLFVSSASKAPIGRGITHSEVAGKKQFVQDGKLEFAVEDVRREVSEIGDAYFGTAPAAGTYTVVTLSVRNTSGEAVTFDGTYVMGLDSKGSRVPSDREAQYYANEDGSGMLTTLAPGVQIRTSIAFDLPASDRLVGVEVHDSVFSQGATIKFKAPR